MEQEQPPQTAESRPETHESYVVGVQISPDVGQSDNPATITIQRRQKHSDPQQQSPQEHKHNESPGDDDPDAMGEAGDSFYTENRRPSNASSGNLDEFENKPTSIEEREEEIIRFCRENGAMWEDDEFPAGPPSLYNNPDEIPEYDQGYGCEAWLRPKELADNPLMFANGATPGDVQQGVLGDCWFLGSICCVATKPELLERLFVNTSHILDCGFVTCQFFKNGEWQQVIVDTRLPYNGRAGGPIYAHCRDPNEMWLPLIEKAYAKLHKTYENLNGGKMTEALVDLTGESSEKYNLRDPQTAAMVENLELWKIMLRSYKQGCLLGCSSVSKGEDGDGHEEPGNMGIWHNHAYGIMDVREIQGLRLLRIRNPWGEGEWKGLFSDEDEEWDKHRGLKDALGYEFGKDGTWWMQYKDWAENYNRLYICRIFPEKWEKFSIDGKWEGVHAGGPAPMTIDKDEEPQLMHINTDSDDKWFNNPQYRLTVYRRTQIFFSLMQADAKLTGKAYLPCNFLVIKTKDKKNRIWQKDKDDVVVSAAEGVQRFGAREITREIVLEPPEGKKMAHFVLVPNLEIDGKRLDEIRNTKRGGRQFWLRIFSQYHIDIVELSHTKEIVMRGEWTDDTAGGRRTARNARDNPLWCKNPQYFLDIQVPTKMKIILRKTGGLKKSRGFTIGMIVCKANLRHGNRKALPVKKIKEHAEIEYTAEEIERKLQILHNEWYEESPYFLEDMSCMYLELDPHHGPFLIIPSLSQDGITAQYSLTIYSNYPVHLKRLEDTTHVALSGEWAQGCAGGSHLYDKPYEHKLENMSWASNPKYLLTFRNLQEHARATITLSRPERLWSAKVARNTVGCMMGLYLFDGAVTKPDRNSMHRRTTFLPTGEVVDTIDEIPNPNGYLIMPATYEKDIYGPFVLSIASQHEFTLVQLVEQQ